MKLKKAFFAAICIFSALAAVAAAFWLYQNRAPGYTRLSREERLRYSGLLEKHGLPPAEYVAASLKRHQIVIIGEPHRVSQHYLFVAGALEAAREAGAACLGMELYRTDTQKDIDRLLRGGKFDETLARSVVLRSSVGFYYQELVEILRSAWRLNRAGKPFGVMALGTARDAGMAKLVAKAAARGRKVLVYCGTHHAFTAYRQPTLGEMVRGGRSKTFRMGGLLRERYGVDAFFIQLHSPLSKEWWMFAPVLLYRKGFVLPFSGVLDQTFSQYGRPVGFDSSLEGFAALKDTFSYYSVGYDPLLLPEFCDGYVYLGPLYTYTSVKPLPSLGEQPRDLDDIRDGIDAYQEAPEVRSRLKAIFAVKTRLPASVARSGFTPEKMYGQLDLRGLEDLYPSRH